jgi:hypothetical protein
VASSIRTHVRKVGGIAVPCQARLGVFWAHHSGPHTAASISLSAKAARHGRLSVVHIDTKIPQNTDKPPLPHDFF